ncbi:mad3/BUB1 homology region 1 domain-containing protein [Ditylenchus destructor]|uniref:Mad3/BUB1 homology region 1 domain-containing protein n=1 Tax=Ditylenchus destructor TaxID=166010 RepID=A0AAD4R1H7_9BILA|nr:mad3/BUB1 homology region 1 domain-containing protein [Ditylenchus destructor]
MAATSDFVSEQYRRITAMANEIQLLDNRFRFVVGQIELVENCLPDGKNKEIIVKRLVSWALQTFNSFDEFKSDLRMLELWKLLGKYSVELKMEGVMKKLYNFGFFKSKPEFYQVWAEYCASQMNVQEFDRVVDLCIRHCHLDSNQQKEIFGPLRNKCAGLNSPNCTASIMRHFEEKSYGEMTTSELMSPLSQKASSEKTALFNSAKSGIRRLSIRTAKAKSPMVLRQPEKEDYPLIPYEDLQQRLFSSNFLLFVVNPSSDSSSDKPKAFSYLTLSDLRDFCKNINQEISGLLLAAIGIQLARIIEQIHEMNIIQCGINPKNLAIVSYLNPDVPIEQLVQQPFIKLVAWKNSIDMDKLPLGQKTFGGRIGTESDCIEMMTHKPWTYQPDYFGYISTIHALMFKEQMMIVRENGRYRVVKSIKRRMPFRSTWNELFDEFLNIPDCNSHPSWQLVYSTLLNQLKEEIDTNPASWRRAVEFYNNVIQSFEQK